MTLHNKGWSSSQLVEELKAAGVPVSPARMRDCLNRWSGMPTGRAKIAPPPTEIRSLNDKPSTATPSIGRAEGVPGDGQAGFKLTGLKSQIASNHETTMLSNARRPVPSGRRARLAVVLPARACFVPERTSDRSLSAAPRRRDETPGAARHRPR